MVAAAIVHCVVRRRLAADVRCTHAAANRAGIGPPLLVCLPERVEFRLEFFVGHQSGVGAGEDVLGAYLSFIDRRGAAHRIVRLGRRLDVLGLGLRRAAELQEANGADGDDADGTDVDDAEDGDGKDGQLALRGTG